MLKVWDDEAWEDYVYWQTQDRKKVFSWNRQSGVLLFAKMT